MPHTDAVAATNGHATSRYAARPSRSQICRHMMERRDERR